MIFVTEIHLKSFKKYIKHLKLNFSPVLNPVLILYKSINSNTVFVSSVDSVEYFIFLKT